MADSLIKALSVKDLSKSNSMFDVVSGDAIIIRLSGILTLE